MPLRLKKEPIKRKPSDRENREVQNEKAQLPEEDGDKSGSQGTKEEDSTPSEEDLSDEGQSRAIKAITGEIVARDGTPLQEESATKPVAERGENEEPSSNDSSEEEEGVVPLSDDEKGRLSLLEREVEESFYRAGMALKEIRDTKLYRDTHNTFEAYCEDRFGFKRRYPYQLIDAAVTSENIRKCVRDAHILPTNEYQLRPLSKLKDKPGKQAEAWLRAVEKSQGKQPTYETVKETVVEALMSEEQGEGDSLSVGTPVLVKKSGNARLSKYIGTWGIVRGIDEQGVTIDVYNTDTPVEGISSRDLESFPSATSDADKKKLEKILEHLQVTSRAYGNTEKLVDLIIRYFATLKRHSLTEIERDVLLLLNRRANKVQDGQESNSIQESEEHASTATPEN